MEKNTKNLLLIGSGAASGIGGTILVQKIAKMISVKRAEKAASTTKETVPVAA